jgi:hypothetical protein
MVCLGLWGYAKLRAMLQNRWLPLSLKLGGG